MEKELDPKTLRALRKRAQKYYKHYTPEKTLHRSIYTEHHTDLTAIILGLSKETVIRLTFELFHPKYANIKDYQIHVFWKFLESLKNYRCIATASQQSGIPLKNGKLLIVALTVVSMQKYECRDLRCP